MLLAVLALAEGSEGEAAGTVAADAFTEEATVAWPRGATNGFVGAIAATAGAPDDSDADGVAKRDEDEEASGGMAAVEGAPPRADVAAAACCC